jgi:anti-sigma factor RsiW
MTCRELVDFIADYLAGALAADVRSRFEAHLASCPECVTYLRGYEGTVELVRRLGAKDEAVPADVPEDLVQAILAARRRA